MIFDGLNKAPLPTQRKLCEFLTVAKTVKREILVKRDVPESIENAVALEVSLQVVRGKRW